MISVRLAYDAPLSILANDSQVDKVSDSSNIADWLLVEAGVTACQGSDQQIFSNASIGIRLGTTEVLFATNYIAPRFEPYGVQIV